EPLSGEKSAEEWHAEVFRRLVSFLNAAHDVAVYAKQMAELSGAPGGAAAGPLSSFYQEIRTCMQHRSSPAMRLTHVEPPAASLGFPAIVRGLDLNSKLNLVVIGCGGRGAGNLAEVSSKGDNIIALCDVNAKNLAAAAAAHPQAKTFVDFRQLYADLKDFDA